MTADIDTKTNMEWDIEFGEYINSCTEADKLLCQKAYDYEDKGYFDEMMFKPGSIVSRFIECKVLADDGSYKTVYDSDEFSLLTSFYQFYVTELENCGGLVKARERKVFIDPKYTDDQSTILHELIHVYEGIINEDWAFYHEILSLCLYNDLKGKIPDLDDKILRHTHVYSGISISMQGGAHGVLFLLKSFDLDIRCGYKLGTICGYGREDIFNEHPEELAE